MATLVEVTDQTDKVEIVGQFKFVQIRSATWVEKDGVMIGAKQFHRRVIAPDADISGETQEVQDVCNAVHTDEVKDAYAAHLAAQAQEMSNE